MPLWILLALALSQLGPQKTPAPGQTNPGIIRGKAVASDTGEPLKHVQISLRSLNGQSTTGANTDASGVYEVLNVDPGMYMAFASKSGFVNTPYKNGTISLIDGQEMKNVDFLMPRAGVVTGTVLDEDEEPVPDISVQALTKTYVQGKMRVNPGPSAQTDDRGNYRLHDLAPGRYYLRVVQRGRARPEGHYPTTLYPNVTRLADAQVIKVGPGQEVGGMKFTLRESAAFSVAGKVIDIRSGQPVAGGMIQVNPEDYTAGGPNMNSATKPDGTFRLNDVTPGHYRFTMNSNNPATPGFLSRVIDVPDHNVNDLVLYLGPGATIKGIVTAEAGTLPEKLRVQLTSQPSLGRAQTITTLAGGTFQMPDVPPGNYDLSVTNAYAYNSGQAQVFGGQSAPAFFISNITVGNQDVTDAGITVPDAATGLDVAIKLDFRSGTITGRTLDADNNPLQNAKIAMVSSDPKKREVDRYYKRGQSDSTGSFKLSGVIPGDYLMLIWPGDEPGMVQDPDVMAQVEKYCVSVSVSPAGSNSLELKLIPAVQTIANSMIQ